MTSSCAILASLRTSGGSSLLLLLLLLLSLVEAEATTEEAIRRLLVEIVVKEFAFQAEVLSAFEVNEPQEHEEDVEGLAAARARRIAARARRIKKRDWKTRKN